MLAGCASPPPRRTDVHSESPKIKIVEILNCSQLLHQEKPVYPKEARRKGIQGTVSLSALITRTGAIADVTVIKGDPLLIPAAIHAAEKWRYTPCVIDSAAVEAKISLDFNFTLPR
jgi:periplasmic protein TonB